MSVTWLTQLAQSLSTPLKWWFIVAPWEQGLRIRGGKRAKKLGAGVHFRIPYWDRVMVQATRLRTITNSNATITSLNGRSITLSYAVHYAVKDIEQLYLEMGTPEVTLLQRVSGLIAAHVSASESSEISIATIQAAVQKQADKLPLHGLSEFDVTITAISQVRALRLMMNDYSSRTSLNDLDDREHRR